MTVYEIFMPRNPVEPPLWPTEIIPLTSPTITLSISVDKEKKSSYTFNEYAVFFTRNITTWKGKEAGFRFPFDREKDEFVYYSQNPFGGLWRETVEVQPNLKDFHTFKIEFIKGCCWNFWKALLSVNGKKKEFSFWMGDVKPWYLVLTAHNHKEHPMYLTKDYIMRVMII